VTLKERKAEFSFESSWYPTMADVRDESKGYHIKRFDKEGHAEELNDEEAYEDGEYWVEWTECDFGDPSVFPNYDAALDRATELNEKGLR
jgi:hypothetical protein